MIPEAAVLACAAYLSELSRWNRRINLTALPLGFPIPDVTVDKLIIEPFVATTLLPSVSRVWVDLGSGGGSPAVPLRTVWREGSLTMVESRQRKCSFLRDVVRQLGLSNTKIEEGRFEALAVDGRAHLVTIRAVKVDDGMTELLSGLVAPSGFLLTFGGLVASDAFIHEDQALLPDGSKLTLFRRS
ncbi:MAG: RsmG family class I SAM-dependent methyltransferase [Vicinamibacterales bacterium]